MKLPVAPPDLTSLLNQLGAAKLGNVFLNELNVDWEVPKRYLHWDKLRHRQPPEGLDSKAWWLRIRLGRNGKMQPVPLADADGHAFGFWLPEFIQQRIYEIDMGGAGLASAREDEPGKDLQDSYLIKSLINEAITSSQLEGAATTRQIAKEMLQSGRPPHSRHERMIANNFQTMQRILEDREQSMTPSLVCELHRLVTENTLENPEKAGQLRVASDQVQVTTADESTVLHEPPPAGELKVRMKAMCDFANGKTPAHFVPPVVRAILLHFWLAHDHPFVDGNGRTARALFYWAMLNQGYWLFEFVSISEVILRAPAQYARSFLHVESDANDLTYFLDHQTGIIQRAMKDLQEYIRRKQEEIEAATLQLKKLARYNPRQVALLLHALKNPLHVYTVQSHRTCHGITLQTARTDLDELHRHRLLKKAKPSRAFIYTPVPNLNLKLQSKRPI